MSTAEHRGKNPHRQAALFFKNLTGEADPVLDFRCIPETPALKDKLAARFKLPAEERGPPPRFNFRGRFSALLPRLQKKNAEGFAIYYVANVTDGEGRKLANMVSARVLTLDLDGAPLPDTWENEPHAIQETSPGKFQVSWMIESTDDFAAYTNIMKRLALHYGGDSSVCDATRVFRVATFLHQKGEPFRSRIVSQRVADIRYSLADFDFLPPIPEGEQDEAAAPSEGGLTAALAAAILEQLDPADFAVNETEGDKPWLKLAMSLHDACRGNRDVLEVFKDWCAESGYGDDAAQAEIESRWFSFDASRAGARVTMGTLIRLCEHHNVDPKLIRKLKFGTKDAAESFGDAFTDFMPQEETAEDSEFEFEPDDDDESDSKPTMIAPTDVGWIDGKSIPPREWLYKPMYIRGYVGLRAAMGGTGKTGLGLAESAAMVTGRPLLDIQPAGSNLRVWYWNGEDPLDEMKRRWAAVLRYYKIGPRDIPAGRFFMDSGRDLPIKIVTNGDNTFKIAKPLVKAVVAALKANRVDVLHIDPFVSSHSVTENDTAAIQAVVETWAQIAHECNCCVILWHHTRKTGGREATIEDARGASALFSAARGRCALNKMSEADAKAAGIPPEQRGLYFWADYSNSSMVAPADAREWYKLESVNLHNGADGLAGDDVGVVTRFEYTGGAGIETDPEQDQSIRAAILAGGPWRESTQAKKWIGKPFAEALGLDLSDPTDKTKVKATVGQWLADGHLETYEAKDENSVMRTFVRLSDDVEFG